MILRRVIAHFRKQEWTAIFIDFVIVVAGVFVGLQVSNWNAMRADAVRGDRYIERLRNDLTFDLKGRRDLFAYYQAANNSLEKALALLADPDAASKALVVNIYRATEYAYNPPTRSTWDEIVSSGDVGLIPREAVDGGLDFYFSYDVSAAVSDEVTKSALRTRVRRIIPHHVQKAIRAGCSDVRTDFGNIVAFTADCDLDVSDADVAAAAAIVKNDPALVQDLALHASVLGAAQSNLAGNIEMLERALTALGGDEPAP